MRHTPLTLCLLLSLTTGAQDTAYVEEAYEQPAAELNTDSLEATFQYQTGRITIAGWTVTIELPDSLKFLAGEQARQLVEDIWGNPPDLTDGMEGVIMYADAGAFDVRSAFIVYSDTSGHVLDDDADKIDYDAMLGNMLAADSADNAMRESLGLDRLELVGWASPPFYDKRAHTMHWATEMRRPDEEDNVLNYNIRVLGKESVINVKGLSTMSRLETMKAEVPVIASIITFNEGFRYHDYKPGDKLADTSLGGLIDGSLREFKDKAKSLLVTFIKVAAIGLVIMIGIIVLIVFLVRRKKRTPMS